MNKKLIYNEIIHTPHDIRLKNQRIQKVLYTLKNIYSGDRSSSQQELH